MRQYINAGRWVNCRNGEKPVKMGDRDLAGSKFEIACKDPLCLKTRDRAESLEI
jgi:hypothetical protein